MPAINRSTSDLLMLTCEQLRAIIKEANSVVFITDNANVPASIQSPTARQAIMRGQPLDIPSEGISLKQARQDKRYRVLGHILRGIPLGRNSIDELSALGLYIADNPNGKGLRIFQL
jgi:hypothetical protein